MKRFLSILVLVGLLANIGGLCAQTAIPYSTGFEGVTGSLPVGWVNIATGTSMTGTFPKVLSGWSYAHEGSAFLMFESPAGETEIVALPEMDSIGRLQMDFYAQCILGDVVVEVGVIEAGNSFMTIDTVELIEDSNNLHCYHQYRIYFDQYAGNGNRIALKVTSLGGYRFMVDDVSIVETPTCLSPMNFRVDSTGGDWVALGWDDTLGTSWEVVYWDMSFDPYSTVLTAETTTTGSIVLDNLNNGVQYSTYVRTVCEDGDYSPWVGPLSFAIGNYSMAVEGVDTLETCDITISDPVGNDASHPQGAHSQLMLYPDDSTKVFMLTGRANLGGAYDNISIIDLETGETLFFANSSMGEQTIEPVTSMGGIKIDFYSDLYFSDDEFEVSANCVDPPTCMPVSNVHAVYLNVDSIVVAWSDTVNSGANYIVEYQWYASTSACGSLHRYLTADTFAVISQLDTNRQYRIRVKAICSPGDTSLVRETILVRTLAKPPIVVPFNCTFEDGDVNANWTMDNENGNGWYIGSAVSNGGDSALYISSDEGATNTYDNTVSSSVQAYVTMNLPCGEYDYRFDWRANGYWDYDKLMVLLIPVDRSLRVYTDEGFVYSDGYIPLDDGYLSGRGAWSTREGKVILPEGEYKLVFEWDNDDDNWGYQPPAAVDNVYFAPVSCPRPSNLVITPDTNAITLQWSPGGDETSWIVSNGTTTVLAYDTTITFQNLNPGMTYYFSVAALCGEGDTSVAVTGFASTTCGTNVLPFFDGFEQLLDLGYNRYLIPCWEARNMDNNCCCWDVSIEPHSGAYAAQTTSNGVANDWFVSPSLFLPENATGYFVRWYAKGSSETAHMTVVVITEDDYGHELYDTIAAFYLTNQWVRYRYNISQHMGQSVRVAFINDGNAYSSYIDDVTIDVNPTCLAPTNMTAVCGVNNIQVSWSGEVNHTAWIVSNGIDSTIVTDTFYTFTDLNAGSMHTFTVRAICGVGDTSECLSGTFTTIEPQPVTTLPYFCDFASEEGRMWTFKNYNNYHVFTNAWRVGTAAFNGNDDNYGMYISNDNGISNEYTPSELAESFAFRTFTLTPGDYSYSFDWRAYGGASDYLHAVLVPVSIKMNTYSSPDYLYWRPNLVLPDKMSMDDNHALNHQSDWTTQSGEFTIDSAGDYNMVFYWYNTTSQNGIQPPAAVDNISLSVKGCHGVREITPFEIGADHVALEWTDMTHAFAWQVEFGPRGFALGSGTNIVFPSHPVVLEGLNPLTAYDVWIRPLCNPYSYGSWRSVTVTTMLCDDPDIVAVGDTLNYNVGQSDYMPVSPTTNYSLCEIIIDSAEIGGPMDIDAIEFLYVGYSGMGDLIGEDSIDIYLQTTDMSEFDGAISLDVANAVRVFHGSFGNFSLGWNTVEFDSTYHYSGIGNLMVVVDDNSGAIVPDGYFVTVGCNGPKTFCSASYNANPDPADTASLSIYGRRIMNERPYMHLMKCGNFCSRPYRLDATESYGSYLFTWAGSASAYEVSLKRQSDDSWPDAIVVYGNSYTVHGLDDNTDYMFRVRSLCQDGSSSVWNSVDFTTGLMMCPAPDNLHLTATSLNSVTFDWTPTGEEQQWRIYVWNSALQPQAFDVTTHPATIEGLSQFTGYNARVVALCDSDIESNSSNIVDFITNECQPPSNVEVGDIHDRSAVVSWSGSAPSYTIEYGYGNFAQGNGTVLHGITGTNYTITGLTPDRSYSVNVRADCDAQNSSPWSSRVNFRTTLNGIDKPGTQAPLLAEIFPNPTSGTVTVTLSGIAGDVTISIVDINGRTWYAGTLACGNNACGGSCNESIDVGNCPQGIFFVRIIGNDFNAVQKLIVK